MRKFIISSAERDNWAKHSAERKGYIDDLIAKIKAYPARGRVTEIAQEGLFDKFAEKLGA